MSPTTEFEGTQAMNDTGRTLSPAAAQALAERVAASMFALDQASQMMGMHIAKVGPGYAEVAMLVRGDMVNGHSTCHGGFIFTLADSAFAFACNGANQRTVASGCSIEFVAPAREGDVLAATARERSASGRTGVYDIDVTNQHGQAIAFFRGKSYRVKGHVIPDTSPRD